MKKYEIVGQTKEGMEKIKFTEGNFSGIIFSLGKVNFTDEDDGPRLNFNYDVHMHSVEYVKEELEYELAEFITERLISGLEQNNLIFTGGVDEN